MELIVKSRQNRHYSQRSLAKEAGISYKTLQLIEAGSDTRVSTLSKIAVALGYPKKVFKEQISHFFQIPQGSIFMASWRVVEEKQDWQMALFDFVDALRRTENRELIEKTPHENLSESLKAVFAASVETLCDELGWIPPKWCTTVDSLAQPYFVSGIENLKASALVESPVHFRKRGVFVLKNFLSRV